MTTRNMHPCPPPGYFSEMNYQNKFSESSYRLLGYLQKLYTSICFVTDQNYFVEGRGVKSPIEGTLVELALKFTELKAILFNNTL